MNNLKNDKGVTLIVLTITVIVLLIVTSITINNSKKQLSIKKVNNLYGDIEAISTKISDYYLKNNSLPVFENVYCNNSNEFGNIIVANGGERSVINSNDDGCYYVLDMSKLENLTLNYGSDYKKWTDTSTFEDYQDIYIINKITHQIYYPKGVKYMDTMYFTKDNNGEIVDKILTPAVSDEFKILTIDANKNKMEDGQKVIINADISLSIGENYEKNTLQYAWKVFGDTSKIEYSPFEVNDETNVASIMSGTLSNNRKYVLYVKIVDVNGNEKVVSQEVILMEPLVLALVDDLGTSSTIYIYGNSNEATSGELSVTMPDDSTTTVTAIEDNTLINSEENYKTYNVTKNGTYIFTATDGEYTTKTTVKISNIEKFELIGNLGLKYCNSENKAYDYNGAAIPKGFYVDTNSKVDTGIVVTDSVDSEGYSTGNEWVWVPVNRNVGNDDFYVNEGGTIYRSDVKYSKYGKLYSFSTPKQRDDYGSGGVEISPPSLNMNYREPAYLIDANEGEGKHYGDVYIRGTNTKFSDLTSLITQYRDDYENMVESVEKYHGFFIGRYEVTGDEENATLKKGKVLTGKHWYIHYNMCELFDKSNENITSCMMYGSLWDATMQWLAKSDFPVGKPDKTENLTRYGNYSDETLSVKDKQTTIVIKASGTSKSLLTGQSSYTNMNNIYDLAGNYEEFSQEAFSWNCRGVRGSNFRQSDGGVLYTAYRAEKLAVWNVGDGCSSRPQFYIK